MTEITDIILPLVEANLELYKQNHIDGERKYSEYPLFTFRKGNWFHDKSVTVTEVSGVYSITYSFLNHGDRHIFTVTYTHESQNITGIEMQHKRGKTLVLERKNSNIRRDDVEFLKLAFEKYLPKR